MNIIITGASKGMGKAIAEKFADGNTLLICARSEEQLQDAKADLLSKFPQTIVHTKRADLSVKDDAKAFGNWCLQFGVPDILVNNAGSYFPGSVYNEPDESLEKMLGINLFSAYHLTRTILPKMIEAKNGHIFNICSIAALKAYTNGGAYSISKFALAGFSKNLREEMKAFNIKVTAVFPGATFSESWNGSGVDEKRIMEVEDIAKMIFAASQLSPQACVEEIVVRPQLGDL
jgi:short-subunit dehydrogenase